MDAKSLHKVSPLICHFLRAPQLSAGKVKVRVLKDEPLTGESSPDPTWASAPDRLDRDADSTTVGPMIHCPALKMIRSTAWMLAFRSSYSTEQHPGNC